MNELVSPYREQDMLSAVNFLTFCKKNGLSLARSDLAFFDGLGLISPPVRPPEGKEGSSAYYSPYQLYVFRRFACRYGSALQDKPGEAERKAVADWYKRIEFLVALDDLYETFARSYYKSRHGMYTHWLKSTHDLTPSSLAKMKLVAKKRAILKQEIVDLKYSYRDALDMTRKRFMRKAKQLAVDYGYTANDIIGLSRDFMNEGSLVRNYSSLEQRMAYAETIDADALIKHEHPYQTSSRLILLYTLVREVAKGQESQDITFSSELVGNQGTHCIYCRKPYSKRQHNQRTCGSAECKEADSKAIVKRNREAHLYRWH